MSVGHNAYTIVAASSSADPASIRKSTESSPGSINRLGRLIARLDSPRRNLRPEAFSIPRAPAEVREAVCLRLVWVDDFGTVRSCTLRKASRPSEAFLLLRFDFLPALVTIVSAFGCSKIFPCLARGPPSSWVVQKHHPRRPNVMRVSVVLTKKRCLLRSAESRTQIMFCRSSTRMLAFFAS